MAKPFQYGGQAVIEGVMMLGAGGSAIAVRKPSNEIVLKESTRVPLRERFPVLKWPILRGCVSLFESLILGMQAITWSASQVGESEEEQLTSWELIVTVGIALVLGIGLFIVVPVSVAAFALPYIGQFGRSTLEGLIRIGLFIGYVVAIGRMKDIQRIFAYHGAEHKTLSTYEAGEELIPENARKYSTIHPRCGTSFILMVMLLMIFIFTFVGQTTVWLRILIKLVMMPVVAGLAYEVIKFSGRHCESKLVRFLVAPGLWLQKLTTREPDDAQLEVAITALKAVLPEKTEVLVR
ncbi:DUF1385 domain-containing protein [Candidatus Formimonas warabiya]|uniref:DUF1385 domain-containing protein n=1 Tax=Formimonas warabiya TaxID=1761012 RepID=A0A3G1KU63_FORW1|nr:DUF1385 domain-containing protein [Candidatus Formimonas warabiya]ATW25992.1 hypothetical protein DCMF_15505 [Candidatus Formimonas warabiya]